MGKRDLQAMEARRIQGARLLKRNVPPGRRQNQKLNWPLLTFAQILTSE